MNTPSNTQPWSPKAIPPRASGEIAVKQLMQRFELAFTQRDVAGVMDCLGPGFEWRLPDGQHVRGRRCVRQTLTERFARRDGPRFSKSRFKYHGQTVIQTYEVALPDGQGGWHRRRGCDVYKVRGGLLVRKDAYWKSGPQNSPLTMTLHERGTQ